MWNTSLPTDRSPKLCKVQVDMGLKNGIVIVHFEAWYKSNTNEWIDWSGDSDFADNWKVISWMEIPKESKRYVFDTIEDVEKKQNLMTSDEFKAGFKTAKLVILQEEMEF